MSKRMSGPTLLNMPQPPSEPVTPSEAGPGTPNSDRTTMSELSTVAIKDGHRGHPHSHRPHDNRPAMTNLDTERADRISRLPGLERVTGVRQLSSSSIPPGGSASHPQGYFESPIPPAQLKERSTVGSASATGSVGGRTTWASGSEPTDATDKMSVSEDLETSSDGGASDGNASLVGFGEGASSTMSGPISGSTAAKGRLAHSQAYNARLSTLQSTPLGRDPSNVDGMTYDSEGSMQDTDVASTPVAAPMEQRMMGEVTMEDVQMSEPYEKADGRKQLGSFELEGK